MLGLLLSAGSLFAQQKTNVYLRVNSTLNQSLTNSWTSYSGLDPSVMLEKGNIRHQLEVGSIAFNRSDIGNNSTPNAGSVNNARLSLRYQFDYLFRRVDKGWSPYVGISVLTGQNWSERNAEVATIFDQNNYAASIISDLVVGVKLPIGNRFQLNLETFSNVNRSYFSWQRNENPSLPQDLRTRQDFQSQWGRFRSIGFRAGLAFRIN